MLHISHSVQSAMSQRRWRISVRMRVWLPSSSGWSGMSCHRNRSRPHLRNATARSHTRRRTTLGHEEDRGRGTGRRGDWCRWVVKFFIHITLVHCAKKASIHQVTTMLATSKNVLFPGYSHLLTTGTDDPSLCFNLASTRAIIKVSGHQYRWLAGGYDLEIGHI